MLEKYLLDIPTFHCSFFRHILNLGCKYFELQIWKTGDIPKICFFIHFHRFLERTKMVRRKLQWEELNKFRPYKPKVINTLKIPDFDGRLDLCLCNQLESWENYRFSRQIIFSEDMKISSNGDIKTCERNPCRHYIAKITLICIEKNGRHTEIW